MFRWLITAVVVGFALFWFPATARADSSCVRGAQVACACAGGGSGVQVCDSTGQGFGPCDCTAADRGGARRDRDDRPYRPQRPERPPVYSKPMLRGGIAMIVIGAVSASIGTFVATLAATETIDDDLVKDGAAGVWATFIVGGALTVAGGTVMVVFGARRSTVDAADTAHVEANPAIAIAPGLGLRFSF